MYCGVTWDGVPKIRGRIHIKSHVNDMDLSKNGNNPLNVNVNCTEFKVKHKIFGTSFKSPHTNKLFNKAVQRYSIFIQLLDHSNLSNKCVCFKQINFFDIFCNLHKFWTVGPIMMIFFLKYTQRKFSFPTDVLVSRRNALLFRNRSK